MQIIPSPHRPIAPFSVIPLAPAHAADAARLHIVGQPGTFLTALGGDVLAVVYRTLPASPVGFGCAATDADGQMAGFAAVTTGTRRLFAEMATRRLGQLLPSLLRSFARHPSLIVRSVQTLFYPLLAGDGSRSGGSHAELLAIMTEPAARRQGIGAALLSAVFAECRRRGVDDLSVTVDAANSGARRFYTRHGFVFHKEFALHGRAMALYVLPLLNEIGA